MHAYLFWSNQFMRLAPFVLPKGTSEELMAVLDGVPQNPLHKSKALVQLGLLCLRSCTKLAKLGMRIN